MRISVLQHVPFEGPGAIADWAQERRHRLNVTRIDQSDTIPGKDTFDFLIVLGGPMSVNDEPTLPWISAEKGLIARAMDSKRRVLGICLGAQLLASVLGSDVYPAPQKEIGWFPVRRTAGAAASPWSEVLPEEFSPLHWHGETFDLPKDTLHLAETENCPNQAFAYGPHVVGLQFHLEATAASASAMLHHCEDEITHGPFEQRPEQIAAGPFAQCRPLLYALLDRMAN